MSNREFTATRTMLANAFATAGAELLAYMGSSSALAAIPETDPPKYVAAGPLDEIAKLLPAFDKPAAATVLTDEVRAAMKRAYSLGQTYWQQADSDYRSENKKADATAGRFIELTDEICSKVAVLAHAGVTAEPARIPPEIQGMADCMVMVRQELIESGVIDATVAPMFIANAVISKLQEVAAPAQVPAAEVRADTLEEAAKLCESEVPCSCCFSDDEVALAANLAAAIRSLAHQSTADKASEVRAAECLKPLADLHDELNRVTWEGGDEGWNLAITAVQKRIAGIIKLGIAAPSTADSANTGALSEKGADK